MLPLRSMALAAAAALAALAPRAAAGDFELFRGLMDCGRVEARVPAGPARAAAGRAAARLEHRTHLSMEIPSAELEPGGSPGSTARLVAGLAGTRAIDELAASLGVESPEDGGFRYLGRTYRGRHDAIAATFEDPDRPGLPLALYVANDEEALAAWVAEWRPARVCGVSVYRGGLLERRARLAPDGSVERGTLVDRGAEVEERLASAPVLARAGADVSLVGDFGERDPEGYLALVDRALASARAWTGLAELPRLRLSLYAHAEDMRAVLGSARLGLRHPVRGDVHALVAEGVPTDGGAAAARAAAEAALGPPAEPWIADAAGAAAAPTWWSAPIDEWLARLAIAELAPTVAELVSPAVEERLSPHAVLPLRGLLWRILLDTRGDAFARELWTGATELVPDAALEERFDAALAERAQSFGASLERRRDERVRAILARPFLKGAAVVPSADQSAGYANRTLGASLDQLVGHGANAISLTVFACQRSDLVEHAGLASDGATGQGPWPRASESDVALATAAAAGRARGLALLLAPHLLAAPSGTFAGLGHPTEAEDWDALFDAYDAFAAHYALLAELVGAEVLCLGTELPNISRSKGGDRKDRDHVYQTIRLERWRAILARTRPLFSGALTYAAEATTELRQVAFWDELDVVAATLFPQLDAAGAAGMDAGEARQRFRRPLLRLEDVASRSGKRAIVTQAGAPSTSRAAFEPGIVAGAPDPRLQRDLYRMLADVLARRRGDSDGAIAGLFVWSWSTDPRDGGRDHRGFTPQGKPAEDVLPELFAE